MSNTYDLLIFTKAPRAYEPVRIYEEALKLKINAKIVSYPRIDFYLDQKGIALQYDGGEMPIGKNIVFRAAGSDGFYIPQRDFLLDWYEKQGAKVMNSESYKLWGRDDKIAHHFEFQKAGIPFIPTYNFGANSHLRMQVNQFPSIVKMNLSSRGADVYKVKNSSEVEEVLSKYRARTLLVQPFLSAGVDVRIIVIGGRIIGAMKRVAQKGAFLTNYSQGGSVELFDLVSDPEARKIAYETAHHFKCDYVGVDLMKDEDNKWVVLEINRACQFQGFESSTQLNIPQEILKFFKLL